MRRASLIGLLAAGLAGLGPPATAHSWAAALADTTTVATPADTTAAAPADTTTAAAPADTAAVPRYRLHEVTVTALRIPLSEREASAAVTTLDTQQLRFSGPGVLDGSLRQTPGFTLFRRSDSRTANPTTQGISLRGVGGSGASRAAVYEDGVPLNDPFGGWIPWSRIPLLGVERVEVRRGVGSDVAGNAGMSGSIHVIPLLASAPTLQLDSWIRSDDDHALAGLASGTVGGAVASATLESVRNTGYVAVEPESRGPVDQALTSRHETAILAFRRPGGLVTVKARALYFEESRGNGTPLQTNDTRQRQASGGLAWSPGRGTVEATGFLGRENFDQTFTAVDSVRASERETRLQTIPTDYTGGSVSWTGARFGPVDVAAGGDARSAEADIDEEINAAAGWTHQETHGRIASLAGWAGARVSLGSGWQAHAASWLERWRTSEGHRTSATADSSLPLLSEDAFSPRFALVRESGPWLFRASVARGFRAPTLNELYRPFRVGSVVTAANERLGPERSTGWELGAERRVGSGLLRATLFDTRVDGTVANVTLSQTPNLIVRQRRNLGRTRTRGVELEGRVPIGALRVSGSYEYADAFVEEGDPALEGLRIPQVPRHLGTVRLEGSGDARARFGLEVQASSSQFEDDRNTSSLPGYAVVNAWASYGFLSDVELWAAGENLLDAEYAIAATPVRSLGPPLGVRVGLRLALQRR